MALWLTRDVFLISLSAFFADAGYQALIAGFPILLVLYLKAPVYYLGIAMALAYGGGSLFAYIGGKLADRHTKKNIAILGNALIPILSFTGLASFAAEAVALFSAGWWARSFRTPARRAMLSDISSRLSKGKAYGFLNALDIGGGLLAVAYLSVGLYLGIAIRQLFLFTLAPLLASTLCLLLVNYKGAPQKNEQTEHSFVSHVGAAINHKAHNARTFRAVIAATAIYGLSFYSLSFPVLTVAQESTSVLGSVSYALFLITSALFGYIAGAYIRSMIKGLVILGYMLAGIGSLIIGLAFHFGAGAFGSYIGIAAMGLAAGTIETLEPTIMSNIRRRRDSGSGMGALTASRSAGLFVSNLAVGGLYAFGPIYAYGFAASMAIIAGLVLLIFGSETSLVKNIER